MCRPPVSLQRLRSLEKALQDLESRDKAITSLLARKISELKVALEYGDLGRAMKNMEVEIPGLGDIKALHWCLTAMACYIHPSSRIAISSIIQNGTTLRASTGIDVDDYVWECFGVSDIEGCSMSARFFAGPVRLLEHDCTPNCCLVPIEGTLGFVAQAVRNIQADEKLTLDHYAGLSPPVDCRCSSCLTEHALLVTGNTSIESHADVPILYYPWRGVGGVELFKADLDRLEPGRWLNDNLIELGLRISEANLVPELLEDVHIFSTFFYSKLTAKLPGDSSRDMSRWTKNIDIFSKRYIVVPIHENDHWYLAIIHCPSQLLLPTVTSLSPQQLGNASTPDRTQIFILDSAGNKHPDVIAALTGYLKSEAMSKRNVKVTSEVVGTHAFVPRQPNQYDCGIYLLYFMKMLALDPPQFIGHISSDDDLKPSWHIFDADGMRRHLKRSFLELSEEWFAWKGKSM